MKIRLLAMVLMAAVGLPAAGRHQDIWDPLAIARFPYWPFAYAEATRGPNQPDRSIDAACERILLGAGRVHEAY